MKNNILKHPLQILNYTVLLQQQRYIVPVSFLFYIHNGLSLSDFLFFQSLFYFTGLLAEIPAGYIGDIFPRKNILIFSYLLFTIRIIMWITYPNYITIMAGEILYGLSKAFYRGVSDGYIYDYLKINNIADRMCQKYGKFNFFMSTGSAISCLIGAWMYKYYGFTVLLSIELICNLSAVLMLFLLPALPQQKRNLDFITHIKRIFLITKKTLTDIQINIYMLYSGILTGITSIFVWNFQPLMKTAGVPVILFGVIYFINHMLRATGSYITQKFTEKYTLEKTGLYVWIIYILCFAIILNSMKYENVYICISTLIFICIAIGVQMIFNIGSLSRIHGIISSTSRATMSSVNSMLSGFFSGTFLMIFKFITEHESQKTAIIIFAIIFPISFLAVKRIFSLKQININN